MIERRKPVRTREAISKSQTSRLLKIWSSTSFGRSNRCLQGTLSVDPTQTKPTSLDSSATACTLACLSLNSEFEQSLGGEGVDSADGLLGVMIAISCHSLISPSHAISGGWALASRGVNEEWAVVSDGWDVWASMSAALAVDPAVPSTDVDKGRGLAALASWTATAGSAPVPRVPVPSQACADPDDAGGEGEPQPTDGLEPRRFSITQSSDLRAPV